MTKKKKEKENKNTENAKLATQIAHRLYGIDPPNDVVEEGQNRSDAIRVPARQVRPQTRTWKKVVQGESSSNPPCAENPPKQQITSTSSSNAHEKSEDRSSNAAATAAVNLDVENPSQQQITSTSSNAEDSASSNAAAVVAAVVNSVLDADYVSATIESASRSSELAGLEPHLKYISRNPDCRESFHILESQYVESNREAGADASTSDQDVKISDSKLLPSHIQESYACNSSFQQSENLQKGKGVMTPDADLSDRFARPYFTAQSSTYSEKSADTRGYGTARLMQHQQQASSSNVAYGNEFNVHPYLGGYTSSNNLNQISPSQQASSSNVAYGNEFNVHPSSRDRNPERLPFNPYLGGYTSLNNLNQISPSQQASSSNVAYGNEFNVHPSSRDRNPERFPFNPYLGGYTSSNNLNQISPSQRDGALNFIRPTQQHDSFSSGHPTHAYQGAQPRLSAFQEQQRAAQRPITPYVTRGGLTVYSGQPSQSYQGAQPRGSTHYGNQGQPSQSRQGAPPTRSESQEQQSLVELLESSRPYYPLDHPGHSTQPHSYQGQPIQAQPGPGNIELDPSQANFPDEFQHQGDSEIKPPLGYPGPGSPAGA